MSLLFFHVYHQITNVNKKADPSETEEKIDTLLDQNFRHYNGTLLFYNSKVMIKTGQTVEGEGLGIYNYHLKEGSGIGLK